MSESNSFFEKYITPIAVVLGAVIIALVLLFTRGGQAVQQGATNNKAQPTAVAVSISKVKVDGEPFIGSLSAPVTLALFFDYQCPYCKQFDQTVIAQLNTNYVQTGKLRIIFKDFQFLGNDSITASEYARAIWDLYPDKFYTWYTAMFAAQDAEGDKGFGNLSSIDTLTKTIPGIDVAKVDALIIQKKAQYDAIVSADRAEGDSFGVQGTPSVIIGTQMLQGGQSYEAIKALIDAQLQKK